LIKPLGRELQRLLACGSSPFRNLPGTNELLQTTPRLQWLNFAVPAKPVPTYSGATASDFHGFPFAAHVSITC